MPEALRSAAAMAGAVDEPMLERDMIAALVGAETVSACCAAWRTYVAGVETAIDPETIDRLGRALAAKIGSLSRV